MTLFEYDSALCRYENIALLCGVDEAGRGPLAGPVCAAAVILPRDMERPGLADSKKLTEKKRELLYGEITAKAAAYSIAFATVEEIEALNILRAAHLAMRRAIEGLKITPELVLVDGNSLPGSGWREQYLIKGDGTSACVAAASVLAKVTRDRQMLELAKEYPHYQFEKHKGYGTKLHYEMLDTYGPSSCHRESFLRKWQAAKS